MSPKFFIMAGLIAGSTIGSYIPTFWGDSMFSLTSVISTFIGGLGGIWLGFKLGQIFS